MADGHNNDGTINVPVSDYVRQIAEISGERAAKVVLETHVETCQAIKLLPKLDARVKELEDCKQSVKSIGGFLVKNWHRIAVGAMLLWAFWQSGGKMPTPQQIHEAGQKADALGKVLAPETMDKQVGTAPVEKKAQDYQIN